MKANIDNLIKFKSFIKDRFPNAIHTVDLVFPQGNAASSNSCAFNISDWEELYTQIPELFSLKEQAAKKRKYRCSAAISQATLTASGNLKICNGACNNKFKFKHNVYETDIVYAWKNCGSLIEFYRKEKNHNTNNCKKCSHKKICRMTDCRMLALQYTNNERNSNPLACFMCKKNLGKSI